MNRLILSSLFVALTLAFGCGNKEEPSSTTSTSTTAAETTMTEAPPTPEPEAPEEPAPSAEELPLPEDFDSESETSITGDNYAAALEELEAEIGE